MAGLLWGCEEVPGLPSLHSMPGSGCSPTYLSAQRSQRPWSPLYAEEQEAQSGQVTQPGAVDEAQSDVMGRPGPRSHQSQCSGPV